MNPREIDDAYASADETFATLAGYSPLDSDPQVLNAVLGEPATSTDGGWFLESREFISSRDLRRHLNWILDFAEPESSLLDRLRSEGWEFVVLCFWRSAFGHGGPVLDATTLRRLSKLALDLQFDLYFNSDNG